MKKIRLLLVALLSLTVLSLCCFGCGGGSSFVGDYKSVFIDAEKEGEEIIYELNIYSDLTFKLSRSGWESPKKGAYESITVGGQTQLLCVVTSHLGDGKWNSYFTLVKTNSGRLVGTPGATISINGTSSAFGWINDDAVSLIIFDKE